MMTSEFLSLLPELCNFLFLLLCMQIHPATWGENSGLKGLDNLVWSGQTIKHGGDYMYITNISDAKTHLSALIEKVMAGEEVIIGKAGKPVAKLVRYEQSREPRRPGALKGKIRIE